MTPLVRRRPAAAALAGLSGLALALVLDSCGANVTTLTSTPTTDASLTIVTEHSPVGPILATGHGATLYDFPPDTATRSACVNDGCVFQWPPLVENGAIRLGRGLDPRLVGTLRRPDGSTQVSYGGHPLYTYVLDTSPGVVMGQAIVQGGGPWYVVDARGRQITTPFTVTAAGPAGGSG